MEKRVRPTFTPLSSVRHRSVKTHRSVLIAFRRISPPTKMDEMTTKDGPSRTTLRAKCTVFVYSGGGEGGVGDGHGGVGDGGGKVGGEGGGEGGGPAAARAEAARAEARAAVARAYTGDRTILSRRARRST